MLSSTSLIKLTPQSLAPRSQTVFNPCEVPVMSCTGSKARNAGSRHPYTALLLVALALFAIQPAGAQTPNPMATTALRIGGAVGQMAAQLVEIIDAHDRMGERVLVAYIG